MGLRVAAWLGLLALTVLAAAGWTRLDRRAAALGLVAFSATERGCPIIVPRSATDAEQRAAETLQATLARAAGRERADFPIRPEQPGGPRRAIHVGATRRGGSWLRPERRPPEDNGVGWVVRGGALYLRAERREGIEAAAGWLLEQELGAQWFMPGPLGEHVAPRPEWTLPAGTRRAWPAFVHRDLGLGGGDQQRAWYGRNGLEARFEHAHALADVFQATDFAREPEFAPWWNGRRYLPPPGSANWQPNFAHPAAARHAAAVAAQAFARDPRRLSFALSVNDSTLFDESPATLAAVSPPRYFRQRPDYSSLVFRFTNDVARLVAARHPDRWLPAYAYYWCENTPDFPIEPNVVPFLTADRSQWSHPEFAAADRALIERWCRSGAKYVGVYDYFYGAPHLAPRPTLYAVRETIPFHHRVGVRAFFAETLPNWGLDGPKAWLAAKLLWDPNRDAAALLDLYFREFWREAAAPMRDFFAAAERTWREQPGPPLWLRFFRDDDQAWIYPPARRGEMRVALDRAAGLAASAVTRARVGLVADAFSVTTAFWEFCATRETLGRLAQEGARPELVMEAWRRHAAAREAWVRRFGEVRARQPLALAPQELALYLRNRPDGRAAGELLRTPAGRGLLAEDGLLARVHLGAEPAELAEVLQSGRETLVDPSWAGVTIRPWPHPAAGYWTTTDGAWLGAGEPWEGRRVEWAGPGAAGRRLRFAGCRTEDVSQWTEAVPGGLYAATARVRARTSPGTATFLIVSFLDANGRHLGVGHVDRLAPAREVQEATLCVLQRAPATARFVGYAVRVLNQVAGDFAEFSAASLRCLDRPVRPAK
jgi:hypothetical protein